MNASELHRWVLTTVRPVAAASVASLDALHDDHDEFMREAGRHTGLIEVESLLLALVNEMQDEERVERERVWADEDARWAEEDALRVLS